MRFEDEYRHQRVRKNFWVGSITLCALAQNGKMMKYVHLCVVADDEYYLEGRWVETSEK